MIVMRYDRDTIIKITLTKGKVVSYKSDEFINELWFNVGSLVTNNKTSNLHSIHQFDLIEEYAEYKGEGFAADLFNKYAEALHIIKNTRGEKYEKTVSMLKPLTDSILDMFDHDELRNFIINVYGLKAPETLRDTFEEGSAETAVLNRDQTFIKDEYYDLATYIVAIKAVFPILGELYNTKKQMLGNFRETMMSPFIIDHKINEWPAADKLRRMIKNIYDRKVSDNKSEHNDIAMERMVTSDDVLEWLYMGVVLARLSIATLANDNSKTNIITKVFNYADNKIKPANKSKLNFKKVDQSSEAGIEGDLYRQTEELPVGIPEFYKAIADSVETIVKEKKLKKHIIKDARVYRYILEKHSSYVPLSAMINILGLYTRDIYINSEALLYIELNEVKNLVAVMVAEMKDKYPVLTAYMFSIPSDVENNSIMPGKRHIDMKAIQDKLLEHYPNYRVRVDSELMETGDIDPILIKDDIVSTYSEFITTELKTLGDWLEGESLSLYGGELKNEIIDFLFYCLENLK